MIGQRRQLRVHPWVHRAGRFVTGFELGHKVTNKILPRVSNQLDAYTRKVNKQGKKSIDFTANKKNTTTKKATKKKAKEPIQDKDLGTGAQLTHTSLTWALNKPEKINKLESSARQFIRFRWSSIVPYQNVTTPVPWFTGTQPTTGQAMYLPNFNTGSVVYSPLHLYDLTSINNITPIGIVAAVPAYQLAFGYSGGTCLGTQWYPMAGTSSAGAIVPGRTWEIEQTPGTPSGDSVSYPGGQSLLQDCFIRINCAGTAVLPCEYEISLVQFREDYIDPQFSLAGTYVPSNNNPNFNQIGVSFWQSQVSRQQLHPINTTGKFNQRQYIRYIHTHKFTIEPQLTIESDTAGIPHSRLVNIRWSPNRLCRYDWGTQVANPGIDLLVTNPAAAADYTVDTQANNVFVQPKAKVFLMIKATALTQIGSGTLTTLRWPSYDINIRKTHVALK